MEFLDIVQQVRRMARAVNEERDMIEAEIMEKLGLDPELGIGHDGMEIFRKIPQPRKVELENYLSTQPAKTLDKLTALMYSGRDTESFAACMGTQKGYSPEECIDKLMEKVPLPEYLERGITRAKKDRVDLNTL